MKRNEFEIEVCANSVQSAINAESGGADRVELCDNLYEGGTTPSAGMLIQCKKSVNIDVFPIIRPRGGDFLYSDIEMQIMLNDIKLLRELGADGFVIGCLNKDGSVDYQKNALLIDAAKGLPITFHRAFDMCRDPFETLDVLRKLGVKRLLTSGQKNKAIDGVDLIEKLVIEAGGDLKIMVGSDVDETNIQQIATKTNAKAFHVSLRESVESKMKFRREDVFMGGLKDIPEYEIRQTSVDRLKSLIQLLLNTK